MNTDGIASRHSHPCQSVASPRIESQLSRSVSRSLNAASCSIAESTRFGRIKRDLPSIAMPAGAGRDAVAGDSASANTRSVALSCSELRSLHADDLLRGISASNQAISDDRVKCCDID